jgi:ABC-type spermidine/putrescine transport system permease subunit II
VSAAPAILIFAVVLAAATSFALVAFAIRGSSPQRTYEAPSLAVKPWVMPVGIMVFVNATFLFASLWGIIFAAVLTCPQSVCQLLVSESKVAEVS